MSKIFCETVTVEEQAFLFSKIDNFYIIDNRNCYIWQGDVSNGYPSLRTMFRGKRIRIRVHRLFYYLLNGAHPLDPLIHVSHLCNNKMCVNIAHLNYEPAVVNAQRNTCFANNRCFGHAGF